MKQKFFAYFVVMAAMSLTFSSCGDKCWECKSWSMQGNGTWLYTGEQEFCNTNSKTINQTMDFSKNDSTDGWECKAVHK